MIETTSDFAPQLDRVLSSPQFQSSRQARQFLEFTAARVLAGEAPADQIELALHVLGKSDFDPTIDASVRKLATLVRQRLEKYYEGPGAGDPVLISLPLRSYAPHFELRSAVPPSPAPPVRRWPVLAIVSVILVAVAFYLGRQSTPGSPLTELEIPATFGDIKSPWPDVAPGGLRLGPTLGDEEELITRLDFAPAYEGQFAGLIVSAGPVQYIALGRRFTSTNFISLVGELKGQPLLSRDIPDREGQSHVPVWLKLTRHGHTYAGFSSIDREHWTPVGDPIELKLDSPLRAGVFAVNGRRQSPPQSARFFMPARKLQSTQLQTTCPDQVDLTAGTPSAGEPCESSFSTPLPRGGDWSYTTRVESDNTSALSAGLFLRGDSGPRQRLVRYRSDSPTVAWIRDGKLLESVPDLPGHPPLYLRVVSRGGQIRAFFSVDGASFRPVGSPLTQTMSQVGIIATRRYKTSEAFHARFDGAWQDLWPLL